MVVSVTLIVTLMLVYSSTELEVVNEVVVVEKTELEKRIELVYNSPEFQNEMNALATSRALYEMSLETQDKAVELSEQALESYRVSNDLANEWKIKNGAINK